MTSSVWSIHGAAWEASSRATTSGGTGVSAVDFRLVGVHNPRARVSRRAVRRQAKCQTRPIPPVRQTLQRNGMPDARPHLLIPSAVEDSSLASISAVPTWAATARKRPSEGRRSRPQHCEPLLNYQRRAGSRRRPRLGSAPGTALPSPARSAGLRATTTGRSRRTHWPAVATTWCRAPGPRRAT